MTSDDATHSLVAAWMSKAGRALEAATAEHAAGRLDFAVNRVYYACFYALSAVLLAEGRQFTKHAGLRAALHQHLIRTGRLPAEWGAFYDHLFHARHDADYGVEEIFDARDVAAAIADGERFVAALRGLLGSQ